jgi:putative transposase
VNSPCHRCLSGSSRGMPATTIVSMIALAICTKEGIRLCFAIKTPYLLELVRYVHLNPVRAGLTTNPKEYHWSSHKAYLGEEKCSWLNTDFVLSLFANSISGARELYEEFVLNKLDEGKREDFYSLTDQRILGEEDFVAKVMKMKESKTGQSMRRRLSFDLPTLQRVIETELSLDRNMMLKLKRSGVLARRIFCYVARELGGFKSKEVAAYLGRDMATVTQGVRHIGLASKENKQVSNRLDRIIKKL